MSESSRDDENECLQRLSSLVDGEIAAEGAGSCCADWKTEASTRKAWHTYQLIGDALRSEELATDPARDLDFLNALRSRLAAEPVVLAPAYIEEPEVVQPRSSAAGSANAATSIQAASGARFQVPRAAGRRPVNRWKTPMSIAAGALAVTGVLMVARVSGLLPADPASVDQVASQSDLRAPANANGSAPVAQAGLKPARPDTQNGLRTVSSLGGAAAPASTSGELSVAQPQTLVANGKLIRDARLDQYLAAHKQFGGSSALGVPSGFLRSATSESRER